MSAVVPMKLTGSCHCQAIVFDLVSKTPFPFMRCYCSICRKIGGSSGYAINLLGDAKSLNMRGAASSAVYHAVIDGERSPAERHFCKNCGSHLWVWDPRWPSLLHPHAGVIDTNLPTPPETVHIMLEFKADWVVLPKGPGNTYFNRYPDKSIEEWHKSWGLYGS